MPVPQFKEQVRALTGKFCEYNFKADKQTQEDLERLKGLLAHSHPGISLSELIKMLCQVGLKQWDPTQKSATSKTATLRTTISKTAHIKNGSIKTAATQPKTASPRSPSKAEVSRQTWRKAQKRCTNCQSYYALEVDHRYPKAKGGGDSPENMRLLCRNCNQRAAIEHFGIKKMQMYLKSPEVPYQHLNSSTLRRRPSSSTLQSRLHHPTLQDRPSSPTLQSR